MPLKIVIKKESDHLTAQATGQRAFPLDAKSETEFHFDPSGIVIEFTQAAEGSYSQFVLHQGGGVFVYQRE